MTEWRETTLGEVCELKRGYDLPAARRQEGDVPIISSSGITGYHAEAKVRAPGVVTGRYGTLGEVFFIEEDFWPLNTALYVRDFRGNEPRFVAALLQSLELGVNDGAAAVPGVNRNQLHRLPVLCPNPETQHRIGLVLGALDDLIENNRRRSRLLEQMAQAIYREWFVHFRYPGHEGAALVDSPLGPIPEGWEVRPVDQFVELVKTTVDPTALDPATPAVGLEHLPRRQLTLDGWGTADRLGSRKTVFRMGDLLFGKIRPYFHKVSVAPVDGICSTDALVIRPADDYWGLAVLAIFSDDFVANATQTANGTKMPRADWKVVKEFPMAVPPVDLARRFTAFSRDALYAAQRLLLENRSLASTRDLLLPKLVTGQIDVSNLDLDALVGASLT